MKFLCLRQELKWYFLKRVLSEIELLVLDVDGVLTDGGLWMDPNGLVYKRFNVRDGLGLRLLQQNGLIIAFISGGKGGATEERANQLGIEHCLVGVKDKSKALKGLCERLSISNNKTAFVGDDLNDLIVRNDVRLLFAPADACIEMRKSASAVLSNKGGYGAVRELAERILKSRGQLVKYSNQGWKDKND